MDAIKITASPGNKKNKGEMCVMATSYDARDLEKTINYTGQEQAARKLLVKMNTIPIEQIAVMTNLEVYQAILKKYIIVMTDDENILLVEKDKIQDFNKIAVFLRR